MKADFSGNIYLAFDVDFRKTGPHRILHMNSQKEWEHHFGRWPSYDLVAALPRYDLSPRRTNCSSGAPTS